MQPGNFTNLRLDDNGRDVHGHVITKDGTVSPYSSLVATTYGTAAIRQKTANRIVLAETVIDRLKDLAVVEGPCSLHQGVLTYQDGSTLNLGQLIDRWEKGTTS